MTTPVAYNNTTTPLAPEPKAPSQPPEQAVVLRRYLDGGSLMVKGTSDKVHDLCATAFNDSALSRGAGPHLEAYLRSRPEGYPKPGEVFYVPPLWEIVGRQPKAALDAANVAADREPMPRRKEHSARQSDGTTRMAEAVMPRMTGSTGIMLHNRGHRLIDLGTLAFGRRW